MSSCFSRCLRVPIAMRRFYEQSLWIPQKFWLTNLDLHHGLLAHYRSTVAVCCGSGAAFASVRASGRLESDRCRESGAAVSRLYVSGSPPIARDAGFVVTSVIHPTVDRAVRRAGVRRHARSCVTIPRDNAEHRLEYLHRECPSRDTELLSDSSPGS